MAGGRDWMLVEFRDEAETYKQDAKVYEQPHVLVTISRLQRSTSSIFSMTDKNKKSGLVAFAVGDTQHRKYCKAGSLFVCTADGCSPADSPLGYVIRRQTWEYYGDEKEITFS